MDVLLFLLLAAVAATALGAGACLIWNDLREHGLARRRALRDHDGPGPRELGTEPAVRVRSFALGLVGFSLLTLPIDLGFAGTFTVILCGSFSFCLARDLLGRSARSPRYGGTMKSILTLTVGLSLATLVGCGSPSKSPQANQLQGAHNLWVGEELRSRSAENAITADRTVFEHHFVPGTAELNPLGRRDLGLLAGHFRAHGGHLDVRRGEASDELFETRRAVVVDELTVSGVDPERITEARGRLEIRSTKPSEGNR